MNAKKAKSLRKLMRNMAAQSDKELPLHQYLEMTNRAKFIYVKNDEFVNEPAPSGPDTRVDDDAESVQKVKVATGQIINGAESRRALYLHLKKELTKVEKARR